MAITSVRGAECGVRSGRPHSARSGGGFTFVELLVAATMMSVLFLGVSMHLRAGVTVWQRVAKMSESVQEQRVALEQLERDLGNAVVYDERPQAYQPGGGQLPEPVFGDSDLQWYSVGVSKGQQPAVVRFVTYGCRAIQGQDGLWKTSQSIADVRAGRGSAQATLLWPGCQSLSVDYAYLLDAASEPASQASPWYDWRPDWDDGGAYRLPRLIRVTLDVGQGAGTRQVVRVFAIPAGILQEREEAAL